MSTLKYTKLLTAVTALLLVLSSCQMGDSHYLTQEQRSQLETAYESMQQTYEEMMSSYRSQSDSVSGDLRGLYQRMQQMHEDMAVNHRQMLAMNMGRRMQGNNMMAEGMGMHMQGHMTGEWYGQMMSMHRQMAAMHERMGQSRMAELNRRLEGAYDGMRGMIPDSDEQTEVPFNEEGDPALLNGRSLFEQNCASCHGTDAGGMAGVFPPLVDSEWVTGEKNIPIRILLQGLEGNIDVQGTTYSGVMPSFKARLSAAEIAAILNYLRAQSRGEQEEITQEDVIRVARMNSDRTRPWTAGELRESEE